MDSQRSVEAGKNGKDVITLAKHCHDQQTEQNWSSDIELSGIQTAEKRFGAVPL